MLKFVPQKKTKWVSSLFSPNLSQWQVAGSRFLIKLHPRLASRSIQEQNDDATSLAESYPNAGDEEFG